MERLDAYRFNDEFDRLADVELFRDLAAMMVTQTYEEVPIYAYTDELDFLESLAVQDKNRVLLLQSVRLLRKLRGYSAEFYTDREYDYFCMVSTFFWDEFDEGGLLVPYLWYTNPSNGVMDRLRRQSPTSPQSAFVLDAFDHDPGLRVTENYSMMPGGPYLARIYIELPQD